MQIDLHQRSTSLPASEAPRFQSDTIQQALAHWNRERLSPQFPSSDWNQHFEHEAQMRYLETSLLEELRAEVADRAREAPTDVDGFVEWFEDLKQTGPGQGDPLFPWLADSANEVQLRWFFDRADRAWIFDNSLSEPQLVARKGDGGITIRSGLPQEVMVSLI